MDCVISGNIPFGSGLSSSSAIVVAVAEASVALNGLQITMQQFVDLCGEGEWFVGSRGGSADHAAIRTGEKGRVARVGFFPFRLEETIPFPDELSVVIANSQVRVSKSAGARDTFNHRVACYDLAELLIKESTAFLQGLEHLRDLNPSYLGISTGELYRILKQLPERANRSDLERLLPERRDELDRIFSTHRDLGDYALREVAIYGISECQRSEMFADLLRQRRLDTIGKLLKLSHNGDRVYQHRYGEAKAHVVSYDNQTLDRLIASAISEDPTRRRSADFWGQSGRYACSTPEIDFIVDRATPLPGVIGAQLAGAGLGGCAMVFVQNESVESLVKVLERDYYAPRGLRTDIHISRPVEGSGALSTS
jgi:N-acetylgalactosamine kinase